jgi:hypothetical protein
MNLVSKSAPYYPRLGVDLTEADFEYFGRNCFNAVRLGVWYRELLPQPGVVDELYLDHVQQVVDAFGFSQSHVQSGFPVPVPSPSPSAEPVSRVG